jgi:hypothetical protein
MNWDTYDGCYIPNNPLFIQRSVDVLLILYCLHSGWVSAALVLDKELGRHFLHYDFE